MASTYLPEDQVGVLFMVDFELVHLAVPGSAVPSQPESVASRYQSLERISIEKQRGETRRFRHFEDTRGYG